MQVRTFIAESVAQAVEQIRGELGPQAVVLNVRRLPAEGLARFWQKPRIELLATVPDPTPEDSAQKLSELRHELAEIKHQFLARAPQADRAAALGAQPVNPDDGEPDPARSEAARDRNGSGHWRVEALLKEAGLLPVHAQQVMDSIRLALGDQPPEQLADELRAARQALLGLWRRPAPSDSNSHVFVGPPGVGKTTALSKWLAQAVLVENRRARVWRLDGQIANTAESLSVLAEILGVPIERFVATTNEVAPEELVFIDLPGINTADTTAMKHLRSRLEQFPQAQIHLVLNAAYETRLLLAQGRGFRELPITDVILTHLDEEARWGKVWNVTLGTNYTVSFLSAGQNLPGDFKPAEPETLLARDLP